MGLHSILSTKCYCLFACFMIFTDPFARVSMGLGSKKGIFMSFDLKTEGLLFNN